MIYFSEIILKGGIKISKPIKKLILTSIIFIFIFIMIASSSAAEWNVTTGDKIQSVIDNAADNDVIIVNDNNGSEAIYNENIVINKNLTLKANGNVIIKSLPYPIGGGEMHPTIEIDSQGSGSTIDGFKLTGAGYYYGICLFSANNVTISKNDLFGNACGVGLYNSENNIISRNSIHNNTGYNFSLMMGGAGLILESSYNNEVTGNNIFDNVLGIQLISSERNYINKNLIFNNQKLRIIDDIINCGIWFLSSDSNKITDNEIKNNIEGIRLSNSSFNTVSINNILDDVIGDSVGLNLQNSSKNNVTQNKISNQYYGISTHGNENTISFNFLTYNDEGIRVTAEKNGIYGNIITKSRVGIYMENSKNNKVYGNTIKDSKCWGINLDGSSGNWFYYNNFINNLIQINYTFGTDDIFDMPTPIGGNYWSNYNGLDQNKDGFGDTPYVINPSPDASAGFRGGQDNLPYVNEIIFSPTAYADIKTGTYNGKQTIQLNASDKLDPYPQIFYTTDGSTPSKSSIHYMCPININKTTTLKFIAYNGLNNSSPVYTEIYTIRSAPIVISTNPTSNAADASTTSPIAITFNENVTAGPNYNRIYIKNLTTGINVSIASKTIKGNVLTIKQTFTRINNGLYKVYIPAGGVKDTSDNILADPYTFTFTTAGADTTRPTVISTNPTTNSTGVPLNSPITITFSETIKAGASYAGIYIKNLSTGKIVLISSKTINDNTLTIKQTFNRLNNCNYQVYIPAGAVKNSAGNSLATAYTFNFSTSMR